MTSNDGKRVEKVTDKQARRPIFGEARKRAEHLCTGQQGGGRPEEGSGRRKGSASKPRQEEVTRFAETTAADADDAPMNGLFTDLYELTMAAGYFEAGKQVQKATFELTIRRLPANRNFLLAAGLPQAVEYLQNLRFTREEIDYLRGLPQFAGFGRLLRLSPRVPLHRRSVRRPRGHPDVRRRAVPDHPRAADRGADPGDVPALRHHASRP